MLSLWCAFVPASSAGTKMLGQNQFVDPRPSQFADPNQRVLTFLLPIFFCRDTYWVPVELLLVRVRCICTSRIWTKCILHYLLWLSIKSTRNLFVQIHRKLRNTFVWPCLALTAALLLSSCRLRTWLLWPSLWNAASTRGQSVLHDLLFVWWTFWSQMDVKL